MRLVEGFVVRKVLDEWIAVPSGQSAMMFSGLISLNETGEFLFSLLQQEQSEESLLHALLDTFDIDEETGRKDIQIFLECLRSKSILVEDAK